VSSSSGSIYRDGGHAVPSGVVVTIGGSATVRSLLESKARCARVEGSAFSLGNDSINGRSVELVDRHACWDVLAEDNSSGYVADLCGPWKN